MSSLCYYGDESIHFKVTITNPNHAIPGASNNPNKKKWSFKNYTPFTDCISKKNYTQINDTNDTDVVMPVFDLIEWSLF